MALAILEFEGLNRSELMLKADTGTCLFYRIKFGKSIARAGELDWVDEISYTTPLQKVTDNNLLLNTARSIKVPAKYLDRETRYAQLFSSKTQDGRSPAFSKVIRIPAPGALAGTMDPHLSFSKTSDDMNVTPQQFNTCRQTDSSAGEYSGQQSIEDLLMSGLKLVAPAILEALKPAAPAPGGTASGNASPLSPDLVNSLLQSLLHGFATVLPVANSSKPASISLSAANETDNRFTDTPGYATPFIFGIDDALLATLAGPIIQQGLQLLPQLMNASNQAKQQKQAANNKLITDILADTNKRLMLQQVLQSQQQPGANMAQLLQLLQQTAAAASTDTPAAAPALAASLSLNSRLAQSLSANATLVFAPATQVVWNGSKKAVYHKNVPAVLQLKVNVPEPAPRSPLPKAIFKFYFRETGNAKNWLEKEFRMKDIAANAFLDFLFTKEEMAILPANRSIMVFAELRWLTAAGKELKALGTTEVIAANTWFLKETGKTVSDERELTDMKVYRSFWNKIWESPVLDAVREGNKKYNWELNASLRYQFSLQSGHDSNGIMPTKMLKAATDPDSLTEKAEGRMKAGLELSISELNKLLVLWDKQSPLDDQKLEALTNPDFAAKNTAECIYNVKLKGRAGERGMLWVIPVFKLSAVTLSKVKNVDKSGAVSETEDSIVQFPLPVAARIIGLKSS